MTNEKQVLNESMDLQKEWFKDAMEASLDTLQEFCRHVLDDYVHDYGTIVHAVAACALAAAYAGDGKGRITGFQAGCVMWEFVRHWLPLRGPARLVDYEEMLYPQCEDKFQKTISKDTAEWLIEQAKERIKEHEGKIDFVHPDVMAHWQMVAKGHIPFGYRVGVV